MNTGRNLNANCYTCGTTKDKSYLTYFDLSGKGEKIVWVCEPCVPETIVKFEGGYEFIGHDGMLRDIPQLEVV